MPIREFTPEEVLISTDNYYRVLNKSNAMLDEVNRSPDDIVKRSKWVEIDEYLSSMSSDYLNLPNWIIDLLNE
jgi:hypothetical protein